MASEQKNKMRILIGEVVSDKMDKTIVVKTVRTIRHPDFHKILKKTKKYQVHDEKEVAQLGDMVKIYEGRPKSKNKYMYLLQVVNTKTV